ncbi:hypothetical protein [Ferribacterium limneticum]|uniref:hypothetical protein n=1 Tax=Ferribacterium limneticum TaxID=76259 RepID=UPI001CFBF7FF|nr:hypothetical protein [Ferribacterium limneticum]UCV27572.1 hypothetical protein KI617_15025 [Ferribacterium limneticum]UCV31489.1 hypothetical protein KI608_15025 [Ferribacterium limneticum]
MRQQVRSFTIRLVILVAILLTLGRVYGSTIVTPMLPALIWVIQAVDDRLRVDHAIIVNRSADTVIQLKVTPIRMLFLGDRLLMPDAKLHFDPTTLLGSVLQPVILLLAIILAWPAARLRALPARLLVAVPMVVLLLVINVPLGFVGVMQDFREFIPAAPVTPMVYWNDFLQTGGPLALAIAAGILVVSAADRWMRVLVGSKAGTGLRIGKRHVS